MTLDQISKIDSGNMYDIIRNFPKQVQDAIKLGKEAPGFKNKIQSDKYLVLGMGGSAIGGSLIKSYLSALKGAEHIAIDVNRSYNLPGDIDSSYNVIASSYSGNTEETTTAFDKACAITKNAIAITTGGELKAMSDEMKVPLIEIPFGMQPRCALGMSFFPMITLMAKTGSMKDSAIKETEAAFEELVPILKEKAKQYADSESPDNPAIALAKILMNKIPVFYSSSEIFDSVNLRWRGQIQENAKIPAFGNFLPEMNHNEINGWTADKNITTNFQLILIRDREDHNRVKARFDAIEALLKTKLGEIITLSGEGNHLLTRMFSLIYLADWTSFYLAMLKGVDPTPIPLISKLKTMLSNI